MASPVNYDMRVKTRSGVGLNIRNGPGLQYTRIGGLSEGTEVHCTQCENGWYLHDAGGWSCGTYLVLTHDYGGTSANNDGNSSGVPPIPEMADWEKELINSMYSTYDQSTSNIDSLRYIYGAPFQFTNITDPKPDGSNLGRTYIDTVLSDMSMLLITPGKAAFMKNFGKKASNAIVSNLLGASRNEDEAKKLANILEGKETGRYYSFETDYTEYMKYVNNGLRISSQLLGIGDRTLYEGSKTYAEFDWDLGNMSSSGSSKLFNFLTEQKSVAFFIDGKESNFSDGMNSSLGESLLAGALNKGSDIAKEAIFLFGKAFDDQALLDTSKTNFDTAVQKVISTLTSNSTLAKQVTDRVSDHATTMINGGNIAFPELWKDSTYNKSYDVSLKLVSPYGDKESFFLYILVPLWHIIALAYPRQLGANGYSSPFLIRGFCKGWFTCPCGIIDSVTFKRASQEGWSVYGFPTEVDVTFSIKDLYQNLTIARAGDYSTFTNVEYMDMIGTWCGVNMNKPELQRTWNMYEAFTKNKFKDFFPNIISQTHEDIVNKLNKYIN